MTLSKETRAFPNVAARPDQSMASLYAMLSDNGMPAGAEHQLASTFAITRDITIR